DAVGARMGPLSGMMRRAGVNVRTYKPVKLFTVHRIQDRTHRRLVIVDGLIGFTGGFGIDDRWRGDTRSEDEWRDLAVSVEGPAVRILQRAFIEDWLHTTGEVLHDYRQFPPLDRAGPALAQVVASSRGEHVSTAKLTFYMAIQAARERVWLENAYFAPDRQIIGALAAAARRGVDVRVVVPGPAIDIPPIRRAARTNYGDLLEAGVKIYEYLPTMLHTKAMVADGVWATVGTINLVTRSMKKNAEVNLVAYDRDFAAEVERAIEIDLARSQPITIEEWRKRGLWERVREAISYLFYEAY
ncbi:MAG: phospholipase D-like domain-containing protein, partial [Acidobacteriota bacterium]